MSLPVLRRLTRSIYFLNKSLVMASGQSVRSLFTPAPKKCKYLEPTHQMADGIRPDQANMIKDSLDRGFYSMHNLVWTLQHIYVIMFRSNRRFSIPPGIWLFLKIIFQIPPYPSQNAIQMPHTRVHSGDRMPPPRGQLKTFHIIHCVGALEAESADWLQ